MVADAPLEPKLSLTHARQLALAGITSFLAIVLVIVFFVTSSDSGSLVIDTITDGGKVDAPVAQRVFWASLRGLGGDRAAAGRRARRAAGGIGLDRAAVRAVLLLGCYALVKGLLSEPRQ